MQKLEAPGYMHAVKSKEDACVLASTLLSYSILCSQTQIQGWRHPFSG